MHRNSHNRQVQRVWNTSFLKNFLKNFILSHVTILTTKSFTNSFIILFILGSPAQEILIPPLLAYMHVYENVHWLSRWFYWPLFHNMQVIVFYWLILLYLSIAGNSPSLLTFVLKLSTAPLLTPHLSYFDSYKIWVFKHLARSLILCDNRNVVKIAHDVFSRTRYIHCDRHLFSLQKKRLLPGVK